MDRNTQKREVLAIWCRVRNYLTISESTQRLFLHLQSAHPEVDCRGISGIRKVLVHHHLGVDPVGVLEAIEQNLQALKAKLLDSMLERGPVL